MTSIANITVAAKSVELEDGQGTHVFTVTNTYSQTLTYGVKAEPDDRRQKVWFEIDGPKERQLADRQSDQVSVNIKADPDVAPGKYTFHLLAYSTRNPGEDFTNGPTVAFVVKEHPLRARIILRQRSPGCPWPRLPRGFLPCCYHCSLYSPDLKTRGTSASSPRAALRRWPCKTVIRGRPFLN